MKENKKTASIVRFLFWGKPKNEENVINQAYFARFTFVLSAERPC